MICKKKTHSLIDQPLPPILLHLTLVVQSADIARLGPFVQLPPLAGAVLLYFHGIDPIRYLEGIADVFVREGRDGGVEAEGRAGGGRGAEHAAEEGGEEGEDEDEDDGEEGLDRGEG